MATYFERTWKPVAGGGVKQGGGSRGGAQSFSHTYEWYKKLTQMSSERQECLKKYDEMDSTIEISRALDIIAEDISSDNADDDDVFSFEYPDGTKLKNSDLKTMRKTLSMWEKTTKLDFKFFDYAREMVKYGAVFFLKQKDGSLKKLNPYKIMGYELDEDDTDVIKYYYYKIKDTNKDEFERYAPEDLLILKVTDTPFGKSLLDPIYKPWRALSMLEDSVVIYRVVRAPERRVFYIDVGSLSGAKAEKYIERQKTRMRQKQIAKDGKIESDYNPASMQEDFFLGTTSEGRGSRIESLPGGEQLGETRDLQWFKSKIQEGMKIPVSWFNTETPRDYNDGRLGTQYIAELRYVGYIKRMQKFIVRDLFNNFKDFATKIAEIVIPEEEEVEMRIALPQSFAIYKENELYSTLLNTLATADQMDMISNKWALEKFLHMDNDEIAENEIKRLMEMGYSEKQIKKMEDHVKMNLVYGDGSLSSEIEPEQPDKIEKTGELEAQAEEMNSKGGFPPK